MIDAMAERKQNERARGAVTDDVGSASIEAIVALSHLSGVAGVNDGVVQGGGSILGSAYAVERGIDLNDARLRTELLQSWCALTPTELVFWKPSQWSVRPKPGKLVDRIVRAGTVLRRADVTGASLVTRMLHFEFPDGRLLLTSTIVRNRLRKKNYSDEPDLLVEALGDAAIEVDAS